MPTRPLSVLEFFQPPDGGVPEHVRRLVGGLVPRGHRVTVAGPPDAAVRDDLAAAGARYVPVDVVGDVPAPGPDRAVRSELRALLAEPGIDLVHVHGQKAGLLGRPLAAKAGLPVVYTPHSFVYRTQLRLPRRGGAVRHRTLLEVERRLGRRTAAIVGVSREERDAAVADGIVPAGQAVVIHNGVAPDLDAAPDPTLVEFRGDGPLLGFVAGLRYQKGADVLLDALELLAADGRAPRVAIIGNGELRDEIVTRAAAPALRDTTLVLPFESRVERYLAALDAFVLPSRWEGMPIAILEAMAFGLPVVATAVDGTPEAIADGVSGLLVPPDDPGALAAALVRLAQDGELRRTLGDAARADAVARFGVERMVDEMEALYRRVAAGESPG